VTDRLRVNKLVLKVASWVASAMVRRVELWDDILVIPPALAARAAASGDELLDLRLPDDSDSQWLEPCKAYEHGTGHARLEQRDSKQRRRDGQVQHHLHHVVVHKLGLDKEGMQMLSNRLVDGKIVSMCRSKDPGKLRVARVLKVVRNYYFPF
jgi:hypothetical protein